MACFLLVFGAGLAVIAVALTFIPSSSITPDEIANTILVLPIAIVGGVVAMWIWFRMREDRWK